MGPRRTTLVALLIAITLAAFTPVPAAAATGEQGAQVGWHVPWAVGGPREAEDGHVHQHPGEWPSFPVESIRLWDTRTAWLNLQPRADLFDFAHLDAHLERAATAGVEHITLVLAGTPRWAASREMPTDAPWLGPGSAAPPVNMELWREFVRVVSARYAGRIHAYEIGNEPNLPHFWNGDYRQLAALVEEAADIIGQQDPAAQVLAPAPLITELRDVVHARELWAQIRPGSVDALTFHYYPRTPGSIDQLPAIMRHLRAAARKSGFAQVPLWITEANPGATAGQQDVRRLQRSAGRSGAERLYWYAWMQRESLNLLEFH